MSTIEIKSERTGYCRICQCYEDENMFDMLESFKEIKDNEYELQSICESFTRTTGIKISADDELSRFVCGDCFSRLQNLFLLRRQAEESHWKISEMQNVQSGDLECNSVEIMKMESDEFQQQCLICMGSDDDMSDIFSDIPFELEVGDVNNLSHLFEEIVGISPSDYDRGDKLLCGGCVNRVIESGMLRYQALKVDNDSIEESLAEDMIEIKQESFNCQICSKAFTDQLKYDTHLPCTDQTKSDKTFDCKVCGKSFSQNYLLKRHQIVHTNDLSYVCNICSKAFKYESSLTYHLQTLHADDRPYACDVCSKTFKTPSILVKHCRIHNTAKSFVCKICSKGFNQANYLTRHLTCHSNERPYVCDMCPKTFKISAKLNVHKRSHLNERPYKCHICPKAFKSAHILKSHNDVHSSDRSHVCEICSKSFKHSCSLRKHKINHINERPYKCDICSKAFTSSSVLTTHMLIHSSERKYVCNICSKGFRKSILLTRHLIVHSNERPFTCNICLKTFKSSSNLSRHRAIHFSEETRI